MREWVFAAARADTRRASSDESPSAISGNRFLRRVGLLAHAAGFVAQELLVIVQIAVEGFDAALGDQPEFVAHGAQQRAVVADQHHRPLEFVQRHGERFTRGEVEVVGRLVEQQQVGALPHDHAQHEPRLFAAAHRAHGLVNRIAAEIEGAEEGAKRLLGAALAGRAHVRRRVPGEADHVFHRRVLRAQHVQLLLREIADVQPLALADFAGNRRERVRHRLHERGLALAVRAENADALPGQHGAIDPAHDDRGRCVRRGILRRGVTEARVQHRQQRVRDVERFLELEVELRFRQNRCDLLHAFERLDPALRLFRLRSLGLETVDELLQMGDLVRLAGERGLLQLELFGAHVFELAVVAAVAHELRVIDVHRHLRHRIEEFAVMADHDQRALIALEPRFQPDQCVEVQVVRRFVEQQQIGRAHQRACQLESHAPAAGEAVDRLIELRGREAQTQDQRLCACGRIVCAGVVQGHVGVRHAHAVVAGLGCGDFSLGRQKGRVALDHEVGCALFGLRHVLRDLTHPPCSGNREFAAVFVQRAVEQAEERRLAGAIAADKTDLFARGESDGGAVEHDLDAAAQRDITDGNHKKLLRRGMA
ncbi:conserved hypothetical protein [Paraburkholderia tropica]